jgi:glycogen synthase
MICRGMTDIDRDKGSVSQASSPTGGHALGASFAASGSPSLRILLVTARFLPRVGGTEIHTWELARRLLARGADVTVLTTERESSRVGSESSYGVPVIRVKAWPKRRDWYLAPAIAGVVASGGWELVHVHGIHTMVLPVTIAAARRSQLPYVITLHSGGHSSVVRWGLRRVVWKALAPWIRDADRLIAVSDFERDTFSTFLSLPPEAISVIPSGVDLPGPRDKPSTERDDRDTSGPLIVSVGRLEAYKGHDRIVRALPGVAAHHARVRLLIVGSGPHERRLRRLAAKLGVGERVEIVKIPAEHRTRLDALYGRADLVVALSAYESQGLAAMEAVARGCSVLVADGSALRELVTAGQAKGLPQGSTEELTAAILRQLREPHHPPSDRLALPTWEQCATNVHALYVSLLRRRRDTRGVNNVQRQVL